MKIIVGFKMKHSINLPILVLNALRKLGHDIKDARRRRRITIQLMAERAAVTRMTISKVEQGNQTISISAYAAVLFIFIYLKYDRQIKR
jgi:transcriptional regulator with XRE-family HTH domain